MILFFTILAAVVAATTLLVVLSQPKFTIKNGVLTEVKLHKCNQNIIIPKGVKEIEYSTFKGCTSLKYVIFPKSITKIPDSMFFNCTSLSSITLPSTVNNIGAWAFSFCSSLKLINVPENVNVEEKAFLWCKQLTNKKISNKIKITDEIFHGC